MHRSLIQTRRAQVYVHNEWGTVCDDLFSAAEATVACNELGFEFGWHLDPSDVEMENVCVVSLIVCVAILCHHVVSFRLAHVKSFAVQRVIWIHFEKMQELVRAHYSYGS